MWHISDMRLKQHRGSWQLEINIQNLVRQIVKRLTLKTVKKKFKNLGISKSFQVEPFPLPHIFV